MSADDENNFFAAPPAESTDAFAMVPPDATAAGGDEAAFLGDVNETDPYAAPPPMVGDAPIVLAPPDIVDNADMEDGQAGAVSMEPAEPSKPSAMQAWNEEWQETLKARKDEESALKAEMVAAAEQAMADFHAAREQKRDTAMAKNREDEQAKLEAIEADLENDNSFQRVCKMIDLSQDNAADASDMKRMRDVLILLKNEPAQARALLA